MCSLSSLTRDWSRTPCKWKHGVFNYWIAREVPVVHLSNQVVSIWCLIVWVMFVSLHKPINPGKLPAPSYWGPKYQGRPVVGSQPSPAGSPLPFNLLSPERSFPILWLWDFPTFWWTGLYCSFPDLEEVRPLRQVIHLCKHWFISLFLTQNWKLFLQNFTQISSTQ